MCSWEKLRDSLINSACFAMEQKLMIRSEKKNKDFTKNAIVVIVFKVHMYLITRGAGV